MSTIQSLRISLVRNWKPVCSLVGDAICGAEFAHFWLCPEPLCPLPLARNGPICSPASSSLVLLSPLFCEQAGCALGWGFLQVNSLSLAIPQFKLLSHVSSLRWPSGHSGPVLTLSNAALFSLFSTPCWWWMRASGIPFCWELPLGI